MGRATCEGSEITGFAGQPLVFRWSASRFILWVAGGCAAGQARRVLTERDRAELYPASGLQGIVMKQVRGITFVGDPALADPEAVCRAWLRWRG